MRAFTIFAVGVAAALTFSTAGAIAQSDTMTPSQPAATETVEDIAYTVKADAVVTALLHGMTEHWLDEEHATILKSIAYQNTVALICDDFEVDKARLEEELESVYPGDEDTELTPDDLAQLEKAVVLAFGVALGSKVAIAVHDQDAYCAHAEEERVDPTAEHLIWVAKE